MSDITPAHVRRAVRTLIDAGKVPTAKALYIYCDAMFSWAARRRPWKLLFEVNPVEEVDIERICLRMTRQQASCAYHPGQCDADARALSDEEAIRRQLATLDPALMRVELKEYGAWNDDELTDHTQNLQRLLWLAAGDIIERSVGCLTPTHTAAPCTATVAARTIPHGV